MSVCYCLSMPSAGSNASLQYIKNILDSTDRFNNSGTEGAITLFYFLNSSSVLDH